MLLTTAHNNNNNTTIKPLPPSHAHPKGKILSRRLLFCPDLTFRLAFKTLPPSPSSRQQAGSRRYHHVQCRDLTDLYFMPTARLQLRRQAHAAAIERNDNRQGKAKGQVTRSIIIQRARLTIENVITHPAPTPCSEMYRTNNITSQKFNCTSSHTYYMNVAKDARAKQARSKGAQRRAQARATMMRLI